jgi:translation initiation factor IF-3
MQGLALIMGLLLDGKPVTIRVIFRGREVFQPEAGVHLLERIAEAVRDRKSRPD